jgi:Glycosyltransferase family 87
MRAEQVILDHAAPVSTRTVNLQAAALLTLGIGLQLALLMQARHAGDLGVDLVQTLLPAAERVADGSSPYPEYGYPPLVAFLLVPLTFLPGPTIVFSLALLACVPAALLLLGVRDPRCYGAALLWAPVFSGVQTGNVTLLLLVAAAACWRFRERAAAAAVPGGLAVAAKLLAWPLVVWLVATRRLQAAIGACFVALVVTMGLWATIGFDGLRGYPSSLQKLEGAVAPASYTVKALFVDAGLGETPAGAVGVVAALAVLAGAVVAGVRGDDRRSYTLALTAMIVATPIVWLHSFALLLAPVALARPRFSWAWLLPAVLLVASGDGNGAPWQTALVLAVAAILVADALRPGSGSLERSGLGTERASGKAMLSA